MHKHWWNIVHDVAGVICDKCGAYANIHHDDDNFIKIERVENCPISDELHSREYDYNIEE